MNLILQSKIDLMPDKPGSYQMKDKNGKIINVGKAKSLLKRVKQYFTRPQEGKVQRMVHEIDDFDIIETNTEKEAFLLEINLIHKYYPKYNIMLKDGKMYPYIALKKDNDPFLKISYKDKEKGYYYFGPFPSSKSCYTMVNLLNKIFPLRKCKHIPNKPCLYYYLGQCLGPCINKINKNEYKDIVEGITKLLNGDTSEMISNLKQKMKDCSEKLEFERALEYKQQIEAINHIVSQQKIMMQDHIDRDIVGYSIREGYVSIVFFLYRRGILLGKNLFVIELYSDINEVLSTAIMQFYESHPKPKELIISAKDIANLLEETLSIKVVVPERGFKKDLLLKEKVVSINEALKENYSRVCGIIKSIKIIQTKKQQPMAFVKIFDETKEMELTIFSDTYQNNIQIIKKNNIVVFDIYKNVFHNNTSYVVKNVKLLEE